MKPLESFTKTKKKPWEVEGVEWREVRLGDKIVSEIIMGQSPPSLSYNRDGKGFPFLQGNKEFGRFYPKNVMFTTDPKKIAQKGYVLLSVRAPVGDVNIADKEYCIGRGLAAIRFNGEPKYLFYLFISIKEELEELGGRGTTFKAITKNHLKNLKIPLPFRNGKPDLETQKKIVEYIEANFTRIDKILEKKKKELEWLDELWESVLEEAFKPKEGEDWREVRLKELVEDVKSGFALSKQKRRKIDLNNGIPQLRPYNIANWNKISLSELTFIPKEMEGVEDYFINYNDVLFNNTNSIELVGRAAVFKELSGNYTYSNHITRIRVNKQRITPDFLSWYLNFLWSKGFFYLKATKWIGQAGISNKKLLSTKIPLPFRNNQPDLEKQKEIANHLDNVYEKIKTLKEKIQSQITQLEEMKESILDEVFSHDGK
ncbi:hypothetical protein FVE67_07260 [Thermosulfurimonas marina]|uniref:Type I restriction modification DNA specificity domain-containing protein n=1 Tax=Thermosulfurimonas marina TaxID=2047767 RepID=A0A6H1WTQ5_9BACT|nr:restriction endonuclease subunit S [Thermosulfurimonas marina]QJA06605.1 hypothetical protein FVE67_07260 [Thermosulfurimonas marina]